MDEFESKVSFKCSVRILFRVYQLFGLVNFTYNPETKRIQKFSQKRCRFILALGFYWLSNLALTVFFTWGLDYSRFVKLEEILLTLRSASMAIKATILVISYITHRKTIVEKINRLLALAARVDRLTNDGSLYYPGSFRKFIVLRIVIFIAIVVTLFVVFEEFIEIFLLYGHALTFMELTFWAHLYGNLTLVCFYQKINKMLAVISTTDDVQIKRRVQKMISISYEIHRVKEKLNDIFSNFHLSYFLSCTVDIHLVYDLLRVLVVVELGKVCTSRWSTVGLLCQIVFGKSFTLQNLYLNSHIAESLLQSERLFRRNLLTMSYTHEVLRADWDQQREIESVVLRHSVQNLETKSTLFVINHRFICMFITEVVLLYAIVAFQQFVGEFVTVSGQRLDVMRGSVIHSYEFSTENDTDI